MSQDGSSRATAEMLREAFDAAFTRAPDSGALDRQRFVLCRAGDKRWAFPLEALEGVVRSATLAMMPNPLVGYAGLVGVRSRLYPAWFLTSVLGQAPPAQASPAREAETQVASLLLCRSEDPLAIVVDAVEALVKIPSRLLQPPSEWEVHSPISHRLPWASDWHPVVSLPAVLQIIRSRADAAGKES